MNFLKNLGVSTKVGVLAALLIIGTTMVLNISLYSNTSRQLIDNALGELDDATDVVRAQLEASLDEHRDDVVFLANEPTVLDYVRAIQGDLADGDTRSIRFIREEVQQSFEAFMYAKAGVFQVRLIGVREINGGDELVRVDLVDGMPTIIQQGELQNKGDTSYYLNTLDVEDNTAHFSAINLNRENGEIIEPFVTTLRVSSPIYDSEGEQFGMIVLNVDMDVEFSEMLAALGSRSERYDIFFTNPQGEYLRNSVDPARVFGFEFGQSFRIQEDFPKLAEAFTNIGVADEIPASADLINLDKVIHFLEISYDDDDPEAILGVGIAEAIDDILSVSDTALQTSVIIGGIMILLGSISAFMSAGWLLRPLTRISDAMVAYTNGDYDVRVPVNSSDEFGRLGDVFNRMADDLRDLLFSIQHDNDQLQATVAEYMHFVEGVTEGDLANRLSISKRNAENASRMEAAEQDLYALGTNLNHMVESLSEITIQVREASSDVSTSATEIQAAATQQISSTTEQDSTVTQTVATVEEVRATVSQTAERARAVADLAQESVEVSFEGQQAVADSIEGMQNIQQRVQDIAQNILMLSERTQQIGEIIETVNSLAEQSKLLALNASIEAARAGEEGKGFAVVAMEVRQLAEQSRDATKRVRDILSEIQQATNTAVMVTEEGNKGAETGMILVERAGDAIRELAAKLEDAAESANQIAASTHQQTNGMEQLVAAMNQIKQATSQTAASSRQTEHSVRNLIATAQRLEEATSHYHLEHDD